MVFYRIKKVKGNYYLVKEWYDPESKRKITKSIGPCKLIEEIMVKLKERMLVRGVGFEPTQACAGQTDPLRQRILSPPPLS